MRPPASCFRARAPLRGGGWTSQMMNGFQSGGVYGVAVSLLDGARQNRTPVAVEELHSHRISHPLDNTGLLRSCPVRVVAQMFLPYYTIKHGLIAHPSSNNHIHTVPTYTYKMRQSQNAPTDQHTPHTPHARSVSSGK
ncbi:hypothetical protein U9M48_006594 [Paspalum notatum var. saurae]|uniref:Uncharacterized protein n=1 Tax=Paspalum notatum var. saurae TaxID=547442 RepID=A0AAQ3PSN2_PASNO